MRPAAEPVWLTETQIRMLHAETLRLFGGAPGLRDEGLLQSALAKPRQVFAYAEDATLYDLVAACAFGLARNHSFVDGNKRVALLAIRAFLFLSGCRFEPDLIETVTTIEGLAAGDVSQERLAAWIRENTTAR